MAKKQTNPTPAMCRPTSKQAHAGQPLKVYVNNAEIQEGAGVGGSDKITYTVNEVGVTVHGLKEKTDITFVYALCTNGQDR